MLQSSALSYYSG